MAVIGNIDLNDPVVKAIIGARVKLLFEKPFFGTLATRLILVDATSWCKTAATDGRHLFYNREFVKNLTMAQLLFLVGHETLHCVYDHLGRRGGRDGKVWNMAIDYITNDTLVKDQVGTMPDGGLLDPKYNDTMTSEEVYDHLMKNSVTIKMPLDEHLDDPRPGKSGDGDGEGDGQEPQSGGKGQKEVDVRIMGKNGPPKLTEEDLNKIRNEIRAATIQACQTLGAGKVPAGVWRLVDAFTQPKMDWRTLLDAHIRSCVKDDYTFQRLSRRSWSSGGPLFPGMKYRDTISIACAIDTSGSVSEEMIRDFLSEVKGIMETFGEFELWLWTFDTQVYNPQRFTAENISDIYNYKPQGNGGTLFECNWAHMKAEGLEPPRFVMFTDGYPGGTWGDPHYTDTLFIIHRNKHIEAPFGMTAYYDPKGDD